MNRRSASRSPLRRGISLLEVLIATAILLASALVLGELAFLGRRYADATADWNMAQRLCLNQLNDRLAGLVPCENLSEEPILEAPGWVCSVQWEPLERPGLQALCVTVARDALDEKMPPARRRPYSLVRWIAEPQDRLTPLP